MQEYVKENVGLDMESTRIGLGAEADPLNLTQDIQNANRASNLEVRKEFLIKFFGGAHSSDACHGRIKGESNKICWVKCRFV